MKVFIGLMVLPLAVVFAQTDSTVVVPVEAPVDSGAVPVDSGVVPIDSGAVPVDSGVVPIDSGAVPVDSGAVPVDSSKIVGPVVSTDTLKADTASADSSVNVVAPNPALDMVKSIYRQCKVRPCEFSVDMIDPVSQKVYNIKLDKSIEDSSLLESIAGYRITHPHLQNRIDSLKAVSSVPMPKDTVIKKIVDTVFVSVPVPCPVPSVKDSSESNFISSDEFKEKVISERKMKLAENQDDSSYISKEADAKTEERKERTWSIDFGKYFSFATNSSRLSFMDGLNLYGIDVGGFFNSYFNDWLSASAGAGFTFQLASGKVKFDVVENEKSVKRTAKATYGDVGFNFPLSLRFGGNKKLVYASIGEDVYKPIYEYRFSQVQDANGKYSNVRGSHGSLFNAWQFNTYLGIGFEFRKIFGIHYQFLLANANVGYIDNNSRSFVDTWKLTLQILK